MNNSNDTFEEALKTLKSALESDRSSFYRDLYVRKEFDDGVITDNESWSRVPLLSKTDLIAVPVSSRMFLPIHEIETIRFTSGTSGGGALIMPRQMPSPLPWGEPLHPGNVLMSFFYLSSAVITARGDREQRVITGDQTRFETSAAFSVQAGVDSLYGPASILLAFAPYLDKQDMCDRIRFLNITVERLSRIQLMALRNHYPNATVTNLYALQEVGQLAYAGPSAPDPSLLKLLPNYYMELLNDDGAQAIEAIRETTEGELILTSLGKSAFPHIRYQTGDRIRVHPVKDEAPLIEILGRSGEERVRIPGGEILLAELERAIAKVLGGSIDDYACTIEEENVRSGIITKMALSLYVPNSFAESAEDVALRVARELRVNRERTYEDGVARNLYAPLVCKIVPFEQAGGKRKHLQDGRK